jgi:ADP-dependent NAD(P)H-hydrate dehydratase / NAD(P)H-hydrate epimerase
MKIVSAAEARAIDHATSEHYGVPSLTLMENAGAAVAGFVLRDYPQAERIGVVCGKGNNGGDGFVVARKLVEAGCSVRVVLLAKPGDLRGDAAAMYERMSSEPTRIVPVVVRDAAQLASPAAAEIFASDVIVDAILGTGFRPPVSAFYAAAIARMNSSKAPIVAVDVPSGADADAMEPKPSQQGVLARADGVVTFTAPRPAHVFAELTQGPTVIAPIGSPEEAITSDLNLELSTPADFRALLAPRTLEANKGSYGHVLVIGGSLGKAGAAAMAGFSALRAGAGLATVATPRSIVATVSGFNPEVMTEPLPETNEGTISVHAFESAVPNLVERKTVLAIGPGISRNPETSEFVRAVIAKEIVPADTVIVLDADALNAFEGAAEQLNSQGRNIVITPHPGEMARLTGLTIAQIQANRLEVARKFAREHHLIVVLKGHRTLTAAPDGPVWVNSTGNPGMATGGTGDVLTGMVAGLVAQHPREVLRATALAVYLHGLAGDLARDSLGETSLVATDLVRFLPQAFGAIRQHDAGDGFRMHG